MSNIKELKGLNVKALAVPFIDGFNAIIRGDAIIYINVLTMEDEGGYLLPPGNWSILGRANELYVTKSSNYGILDFLFEHGWRDYEDKTPDCYGMKTQTQSWQSYCAANNLTNQLILINL